MTVLNSSAACHAFWQHLWFYAGVLHLQAYACALLHVGRIVPGTMRSQHIMPAHITECGTPLQGGCLPVTKRRCARAMAAMTSPSEPLTTFLPSLSPSAALRMCIQFVQPDPKPVKTVSERLACCCARSPVLHPPGADGTHNAQAAVAAGGGATPTRRDDDAA
jgi:hypothetical protein